MKELILSISAFLFLICIYAIGYFKGKQIKNSWYCVWQSYHARTLIDGTIEVGCFVKIVKAKSKEEAIGRFVEITKGDKVVKRLDLDCEKIDFI